MPPRKPWCRRYPRVARGAVHGPWRRHQCAEGHSCPCPQLPLAWLLVMIGILFWPTETAPPDEASLDSAKRSQRAPTGVHITSVWVRKCCYGGGHARGWVVSLETSVDFACS